MKFTLTIQSDNAALTDDLEYEVVRILGNAINGIESGAYARTLLDSNGNTVGRYVLRAR